MNPTTRRNTVHAGPDDPSLTPHAGLVLVGELVHNSGLLEQLDTATEAVRPFKQRRRGLSGGELLVSVAESILIGGDHLVHLDELRWDQAGASLRAVAEPPAPTTAGQLLPRFDQRQCRAAVGAMAEAGNHFDRHLGLPVEAPVTLDLDSTPTEVYGHQELAEFNYEGKRNCGSLLATWAQRRRLLAADLRRGAASDKPAAAGILTRALQTLPPGHGPVSLRADSGFYCGELIETARRKEVSFSISVPRNAAMWEARRHTGPNSWHPALGMEAEIAEVPYRPGFWKQEPLRLIIRRVRIPASELSQNPRNRRRRTVAKGQLRLALADRREYVYGYSFMLTDRSGDAAEIELEHRQRAQIEERIKDVKLGCALRHLPMRSARGNRAWQTAAVLATNLASMLSTQAATVNHEALVEQAAQAEDEADLVRPAHHQGGKVARHNSGLLRRWLIDIPARLIKGGRQLRLRFSRGMTWKSTFWATYSRLRLLSPPLPA
ncbi:MAG: IS1380 family transposase [Candidatus Dormibacteria bacterium]